MSFTTIPDSSSSAIRFGMLISPLNVSAMSQSSPKSSVAPRIDTNEYITRNGRTTLLLLNRNCTKREPYSPQPIIVENAKQHSATAVKIDDQLPYVVVKPEIVSSAPAATP